MLEHKHNLDHKPQQKDRRLRTRKRKDQYILLKSAQFYAASKPARTLLISSRFCSWVFRSSPYFFPPIQPYD